MLHASSFEVFITSAGAIDDNLANFIATNEQITISKATAELREYSAQARAELSNGGELIIPFIGRIVEEYGRLIFITDTHLQFIPPPISALRSDALAQQEHQNDHRGYSPPPNYDEPSYREPEPEQYPEQGQRRQRRRQHEEEPLPEAAGVNWKKVVMAALIVISVLAGAIYGIRLFKTNDYTPAEKIIPPVIDSSLLKPKAQDTTSTMASPAPAAADNNDTRLYNIIIDNYPTRKKAEKRAQQMKSYGHDVDVLAKDSTSFLIIMPVRCRPADTTQLLDSLSNIYNPTGVSIYQ
jgi:hypothetical protein